MIEVHPLLAREAAGLIGEGRAAFARVVESAHAGPRQLDTSAPDPNEAIHDLRVALRRLRSVLRPMRFVYGKRRAFAIEERLRAILDLTSELRDEEVLRETLTELDVDDAREPLLRWMTGRARRERGLRGRATHALGDEQDDAGANVERCLASLEHLFAAGPKRAIGVDGFRRAALARALEDLDARVEVGRMEDGASMHRVRIGAKRVRYVAELLGAIGEAAHQVTGGADAVRDRVELESIVELQKIERAATRIQKRLGTLHDLDEALSRMGRAWGLDEAPRKRVLEALRRARAKLATKIATELQEDLRRIRTTAAIVLDERRASVLAATRPEGRPEGRDEDATG